MLGFFGRILCVMKKEGKKVTDFPHSQFHVPPVCGMWDKTPQGLCRGATPAPLVGEAAHPERQIAVLSVR